MASIKDVARACGVSVATVSKAMNDKSDIGLETKRAIKQKAKEMGYVPQYYARAIRTNRSYNLGVLFMDEAMSGLTHDYFSRILNSFKVMSEEKGYDITFINAGNSNIKRSYLESVRYRGLDGVIIACIFFDNEKVRELIKSDVPVVAIDYKHDDILSVMSDNYQGMNKLVEYIISQGHKKIAYIYGDISDVTTLRVQSFKDTMKKNNIEIREDYLFRSQYRDLKKAREYTKQLLEMNDPPTCVIYPDDYSAIGGMAQIREMGYKIPDDISVAGYDDIFVASQLQPRLTTISQDTDAIGRRAAGLLIDEIENIDVRSNTDADVERCIVIGTELEKGESVKNIS